MNKFIVFTTMVIFGLSTITAQEVTFGVKAGANISNLSGNDTEGFQSKTSFHIGGVMEVGISEKFSVQPELIYSLQGVKGKSESDSDINLNYINIPVLAKFYLIKGLSIEGGPQIGFLASAKQKLDGEREDIKDFLNQTDFSACIGLGYRISGGLNLAARYNLGISNIYNKDAPSEFSNKNEVIQVSLGIMF